VLGLLLLPVLGTAAAVMAVGLRDPALGAVVGMAAAGLVALLSGAGVMVLARRWSRRGSRVERPRALLGLGLLVWGAGQFLVAREMTPQGRRVFGSGDWVSTLAVPILLLALLSVPRRSRVSGPAVRLLLDVLAVSLTATLAVWWLLLQPALPATHDPGGPAATGVLMVLLDLGVAAVTTLTWVRDRPRGGGAVSLGLVLQAGADITSLPAVLTDRPLSWASGAIWCVGIPLLGYGMVSYTTERSEGPGATVDEDLGESRATMVATVGCLLVLAGPWARRRSRCSSPGRSSTAWCATGCSAGSTPRRCATC